MQLWKINDLKAQKSGERKAVVDEKGNVYQGDWHNNEKHGFGIQVWRNGNKYEGQWQSNARDGHGTLWIKAQSGELCKIYSGNWKLGQKSGLGAYYFSNGDRYEGEYLQDNRHGQGTLFYANGDRYVGEWRDNLRSGSGTYTFANKDVYEGGWINDQKDGAGIFYYKTRERVYEGTWVNGIAKCGIYMDAHTFFDTQKQSEGQKTSALLHSSGEPCFNVEFTNRDLPELCVRNVEQMLAEQRELLKKERSIAHEQIRSNKIFSDDELEALKLAFDNYEIGEGTGAIKQSSVNECLAALGLSLYVQELDHLAGTVDFQTLLSLAQVAKDKMNTETDYALLEQQLPNSNDKDVSNFIPSEQFPISGTDNGELAIV